VIRNVFVNPSGAYVDVATTALDQFGYSYQCCRVNNEFGNFVELEYHAPATGEGPDPAFIEDVSQVWAFRGSSKLIEVISHRLLGCSLDSQA
jgi:hypothetical protein